jgi:hypothetical protein
MIVNIEKNEVRRLMLRYRTREILGQNERNEKGERIESFIFLSQFQLKKVMNIQ